MKKQLVHFSIFQTCLVIAVLYLVLSAIAVAVYSVGIFAVTGYVVGIAFLFAPVAYAIASFISLAIFLWFYNLIAKKMGGIEFTVKQVEEEEKE